jgi:hypothetical protein
MPSVFSSFLIWAQAAAPHPQPAPATATNFPEWLQWLFVWGEPGLTDVRFLGGLMTWAKVVGLFCLLGWSLSWIVAAFKEPDLKKTRALDIAAAVALLGGLVCALLQVLEANERLPLLQVRGVHIVGLIALGCSLVILAWAESKLWASIRRLGTRGDLVVLTLLHAAMALGLIVFASILVIGGTRFAGNPRAWQDMLVGGARLGATYMGLVVLARVVLLLLPEILALRGRRVYSIAWQCWVESFRRMAAPWVVLVVFGVILAFTSWFLTPPREAELGRLYVGTLTLLCSLLLTVTVTILAPISLPNDIRQQTIYTVVSKPVRRLELIWGRMIGYMALVTVLLLFFGGVSLIYVDRMVDSAIKRERLRAEREEKARKPELARLAREAADQLETRLSARLPVKGVLTFVDSRGMPRRSGIDVGQELEYRSFIEGATPSRAIWQFGESVRDPFTLRPLDRRVPIEKFLIAGTVEATQDQIANLQQQVALARRAPSGKNGRPSGPDASAAQAEIKRLSGVLADLQKRDRSLRASGKLAEAARLHSRAVPINMTFNVYRTTKGEIVGDPVLAAIKVRNEITRASHDLVLPIREYYDNRTRFPSSILVGSHGRVTIEVQCMTANQYLGMAESDLFILAGAGGFEVNFLKGLVGIWLQAMVLTAIGVCAGTFLSWPVALLTTIGFFIGGQVGFAFLQQFALQGLIGGGPFESLIRLLSHENQVSELAPTLGVIVARTLDSIVMPVMSRLVYLVPNFSALDVSNMVAEGFAVTREALFGHLLTALAYAMPFSVAGYFILKNREVAA